MTRPLGLEKMNPHHDAKGRFSSAGVGAGSGGGPKSYMGTLQSSTSSIADKHLGISSLEETNSGRDFHEVGVVGVSRALGAAYRSGQLAAYAQVRNARGIPQKVKEISPELANGLAVRHFNRPHEEPLKPKNHDAADFKEVSVTSVKDGLRAAFDAGYLHVQRSVATPGRRRDLKELASSKDRQWVRGQLRPVSGTRRPGTSMSSQGRYVNGRLRLQPDE